MTGPQPFSWCFDRSPWDNGSEFVTFSVGIYQWIPKASGKGLKKSNTIRVVGHVADSKAVYSKAEELCRRFNKERVRSDALPNWVQKQYSVPRSKPDKKITVKDRVMEMARDVWGPEMKRLGFRRAGRKFWRDNDEVCHVVELNMNRWGTSTESSVHVNMGVYWHEIEKVVGGPPLKTIPPPEYRCTYRIDLGGATPQMVGKSWDVDLETDMTALGREILAELIQYGLPWLEFRSDLKQTQNWKRYSTPHEAGGHSSIEWRPGWAKPVFLVKLGKVAEAKKELESWLTGEPDDKDVFALAKKLRIDISDARSKKSGATNRGRLAAVSVVNGFLRAF